MTTLARIATAALSLSMSLGRNSAGAQQTQKTPDLTVRRSELMKMHEQTATRAAGDFIGAISSVIAPHGFYNAALLPLGKGPAAARAFLERDSLNSRSRARLTVIRLDVSADGNDGYSYGYLDLVRPNGDTLPGAYKAYWRRGPEGQWQALAFGRGRRERGPIESLPDSLRPRATAYKIWPGRDSVEMWASLKATELAFSDSAATNVRAAFMSFAATDAGKISGARYVFGRDAIGQDFVSPPPGFNGMKWHAEWGTVARSNDLGFNVGPVTLGPTAANQPGNSGGLFFTVWRRQPNGEWKFLVD